MTPLVAREKDAHWYTREGVAMHTIIGANKKERATNLRDARKLGLLPSVTSVLDVIAKPGLIAWIIEQNILASLTLPRVPGETDDDFAKRVVADAEAQRDKAAVTGTRIHKAIEQLLCDQMPDPEMAPHLISVGRWLDQSQVKPISVEFTAHSREHGYAGRGDLYALVEGVPAIVDFKSQDVKKDKANFYETWPLQLSAYGQAILEDGKPVERHYSVVIDTKKGMPAHVKCWSKKEADFGAFKNSLALWKYIKDYDPLAPIPAV